MLTTSTSKTDGLAQPCLVEICALAAALELLASERSRKRVHDAEKVSASLVRKHVHLGKKVSSQIPRPYKYWLSPTL